MYTLILIWVKLKIYLKQKHIEQESITLAQNKTYLKAACDFTNRKDIANFFYSCDDKIWKPIGK